MNAIQFIKLYGLHSARVTVEDAQENTHYCTETGYHSIKLDVAYEPCPDCVCLSELKRIVESVDLVNSFNGLEMAKQFLAENIECSDSERLKQAIADYEAIHSLDIEKREFELGLAPDSAYVKINDMGDDTHIENHVSPLCKMGGEVMRSEFEKWYRDKYQITKPLYFFENTQRYEDGFTQDAWEVWQHQQSKVDELQKRLDAALKVAQSIRKEIEHGHLSDDESQTLSSYANDLEQALKGGGE